jgi:hypothetical protein
MQRQKKDKAGEETEWNAGRIMERKGVMMSKLRIISCLHSSILSEDSAKKKASHAPSGCGSGKKKKSVMVCSASINKQTNGVSNAYLLSSGVWASVAAS